MRFWRDRRQAGGYQGPASAPGNENSGSLFRSRAAVRYSVQRPCPGYITDREVSKLWLEAKRLAVIPESVVLYCARHRCFQRRWGRLETGILAHSMGLLRERFIPDPWAELGWVVPNPSPIGAGGVRAIVV